MTEPSEMTLAIIGAGPLGRSLALRAVRAGVRVVLEDVMPSNLRHAQEQLRLALGEALDESAHRATNRATVVFVSTVEDAVRQADLAIDCVPDELESKLEIFSLLDRMAPPRTVLLTPTQALSIADLASCTYRPERCLAIALSAQQLAAEPATFGSIIPLQRTLQTDAAAEALVVEFWHRLGCSVQMTTDAVTAAQP
jgi:3-hydroxybutyryl-CoA dehydrogenase